MYHVFRGHQNAFILGTMHAGVPLSALPDSVHEAIDTSDVGVTESVENNWLLHKWNSTLIAGGLKRFGNQRSLLVQLDSFEYGRLSERLRRAGLSFSEISSLSPLGAVIMLGYYDPITGPGKLDAEIDAHFRSRHKKIIGLVSERSHVKNIRASFNIEFLKRMLHADDSARLQSCNVYWHGNEESLRAEADVVDPNDKLVQRVTLARNHAYALRIAKIMSRYQQPFFFLGVGHLFGGDGVLALLERAGFRVSRAQ